MENLLSSDNIRIAFSILSITFGVWQYVQRRKVEKIITIEAVELHNNIAVALGATDAAINAINNNGNVSASVGRSQGLCQAVLHESAKLYCNLKNTSLDDIDKLVSDNQLAERYREIYYSYSTPRRGFFGKIKKWFTDII